MEGLMRRVWVEDLQGGSAEEGVRSGEPRGEDSAEGGKLWAHDEASLGNPVERQLAHG